MIFREVRKLNLKVGDAITELTYKRISTVTYIIPSNRYRYITDTGVKFNLYGMSNEAFAELFQGNPIVVKAIMCNHAYRVLPI